MFQGQLKELNQFYELSLFSKKRAKSIGSRLLVLVLCISSLFVIFQTLFQLHEDYQIGLTDIDRRFDQLERSYGVTLSRSVWEFDQAQIFNIVEGLLETPDVVLVTVLEGTSDPGDYAKILAEVGYLPESKYVQKSIPLTIRSGGKTSEIGLLQVTISLNTLYEGLYGTVAFILLFQVVKTFLMSAFILAIFHFLVTRHLITMSNFSNNTSTKNLDDMLMLDRKVIGEEDEISAMCDALNETKKNLKRLVESNQASVDMQLELSKKEEQEKAQNQFRKQIENKNTMLAESNRELESTIDQLKETQGQLVKSEKMAALGGMVNGVAHELNTPIGLSITGTSHIRDNAISLNDRLAKNKMTKSDLDDFLDNTINLSTSICVGLDKAASLIKSFKLVSVEQHDEVKQYFDVRRNLEDLLYSVRPSIKGKNVTVVNNIDENINFCSFPGVFYQIFTNLINNCVLHAFEGKSEGEINIYATFEDNHLLMSVADNGRGMSDEAIEKVFDPFFTTKRANGGTGLGMSIIFNLVNEKLQGTIAVESEEGVGTTFNLRIPSLIESD